MWNREHWRAGHSGRGVTVAVGMVQILGVRAAAAEGVPVRDLDVLAYLLLVVGPLALLWRRRAPVQALGVTAAATLGYALTGPPHGPFYIAFLVTVFTAVKAGHRVPAGLLVLGAFLAWLTFGWVLADPLGLPAGVRPTPGRVAVTGIGLLVVMLVGNAARARAEHLAEMAKVRAERARTRAELQRRQASEERLRIARELHDVLGHHLSLINVQAGVGLHLMDSRPEQAREALAAIKGASAEALREVRSVLGVLRPDEETAPRQPALGLDRLADLTADAGLPVRTRVRGAARPVPAEVDRAAYRIVQEALTNVRRHAGPRASAVVTLGYDDAALRLRVDDDGAGREPAAATVSDGGGIAGMRARAQALGGTLEAGPGPDGGFRVSACLPTTGTT